MLTLESVFKTFWAIFFHRTYKLSIDFDKICVGLYFGRFSWKLIWPPWLRSSKSWTGFWTISSGTGRFRNFVQRIDKRSFDEKKLQFIFVFRQGKENYLLSPGVLLHMYVGYRVTRMGELSPMGPLVTLDCLLKITKVAQIRYWATFFVR
jgi:hypothetical protein